MPEGAGIDERVEMSAIRWILTIAIIAVSIVMTVVILMQEGRSQGLGAISGAAETYWGKNKGRSMEGFLEKWNNRYTIANICVFDSADRRNGVGTKLIETILDEAVRSGARMAVLETQSYNFKAISFYKKNGFQIIGFDRYAYSNRGPEEHNMRIEMGKKLQD